MRDPLQITLMGVMLNNPVIAASGTFGFGREYAALLDTSKLGGIAGKGLTLHGSPGNSGERIWETPAGVLNSIGLENPGVQKFVREEAPYLRSLGCAALCNLGGHTEREYVQGAALLNEADIDILELNISCPNVKAGGMAFGLLPEAAASVTRLVKRESRHPVLVKLTPNAPDIVAVAQACENAGADGVSLVNTFLGMAIDIKRRKPVFENIYAGLSGPAIFPIALRMVHQVCQHVSIPVVGGGGIMTAEDAICYLMAGARAVQVGSATFTAPTAILDIINGMRIYCEEQNLRSIEEIMGII